MSGEMTEKRLAALEAMGDHMTSRDCAALTEVVLEVRRLRAELGITEAVLRSAKRSRDTLDAVIDKARRVLAESPSAEGAAAALAVLDSVRAPARGEHPGRNGR